ncbi:WYL domain-containing protein [Anaerobranca gottschalkii]|uniref:WYL domain-containing protein n=1 Tax=Anaerobranca gottschalkii DSM 13577 TaxID=1120990 RepID=A0A1I0A9G1_9FIRM|nr:WYL domain-containing protein [Anaerobranca gottschalkii]SES90796.1 WYL domain-containing protein [Anaerobranca gottschalkii DSM 13577]
MRIFNPLTGIEFGKVVSLLNSKNNEYISLADLSNFNIDISEILYEVEKNKYLPIISGPIPYFVTKPEKVWLKNVLTDPKIRLFLSDITIEKLNEKLVGCEDIISKNLVVKGKGITDSKNLETVEKNFKEVLNCIINELGIIYNYRRKDGTDILNKKSYPLKIEYSVKDDIFYLIHYSIDEDKIVKGILSNFTIDEKFLLDDEVKERGKNYLKNFIKKDIKKVTLEVYQHKNGLERTFYLFSCFKRKVKYIKEENRYLLTIYYYFYEEMEVIHRILSLGETVKVLSPLELQREIVSRIKKAKAKYL